MMKMGSRISFRYPTCTEVFCGDCAYQKRELTIEAVRDLVFQPLSVADYLRRPFLSRSRWLVAGTDNHGEFRHFYLGNSLEHRATGILRVGVYDARKAEGPPIMILSPLFHPTRRSRRILAHCLAEWESNISRGEKLGVFADDLQIVEEYESAAG